MKCRHCRVATGTIFFDARNRKTKTALCQQCYEAAVRDVSGFAAYAGHYRGHGRDPYHDKLPPDHPEAQEWWDYQNRITEE